MGTIGFKNLKVCCIIGLLPKERILEQEIYIDLQVTTDFGQCISNDGGENFIDYVKLSELCIQTATEGQFQLLETCSHRILSKVIQLGGVSKAKIRIKKPFAIASAEYAFTELEMEV